MKKVGLVLSTDVAMLIVILLYIGALVYTHREITQIEVHPVYLNNVK